METSGNQIYYNIPSFLKETQIQITIFFISSDFFIFPPFCKKCQPIGFLRLHSHILIHIAPLDFNLPLYSTFVTLTFRIPPNIFNLHQNFYFSFPKC